MMVTTGSMRPTVPVGDGYNRKYEANGTGR